MEERQLHDILLAISKWQGATETSMLHFDKALDSLIEKLSKLEDSYALHMKDYEADALRILALEKSQRDTDFKKVKAAILTGAGGGTVPTVLYVIGWLIKGLVSNDWSAPIFGGN